MRHSRCAGGEVLFHFSRLQGSHTSHSRIETGARTQRPPLNRGEIENSQPGTTYHVPGKSPDSKNRTQGLRVKSDLRNHCTAAIAQLYSRGCTVAQWLRKSLFTGLEAGLVFTRKSTDSALAY